MEVLENIGMGISVFFLTILICSALAFIVWVIVTICKNAKEVSAEKNASAEIVEKKVETASHPKASSASTHKNLSTKKKIAITLLILQIISIIGLNIGSSLSPIRSIFEGIGLSAFTIVAIVLICIDKE